MKSKKNKSKYALLVVFLVVIFAAGYFAYSKSGKKALAPEIQNAQNKAEDENLKTTSEDSTKQVQPNTPAKNNPAQNPAKENPMPSAQTTEGVFSSGDEQVFDSDVMVEQVVFDGKEFSPNILEIKKGDVVIFKNSGSKDFWPASDPHPAHTDYLALDAGKAIPSGGRFQVQFLKAGIFGYHDDLNSGILGRIVVSEK